jgi:hypothetical protein
MVLGRAVGVIYVLVEPAAVADLVVGDLGPGAEILNVLEARGYETERGETLLGGGAVQSRSGFSGVVVVRSSTGWCWGVWSWVAAQVASSCSPSWEAEPGGAV